MPRPAGSPAYRALLCACAALAVMLAACSEAPEAAGSPPPASTPAPEATGAPAPIAEAEAPGSGVPGSSGDERGMRTEVELTGPIVVLDPGHGGDDIGAAAHGVIEKESNLDMAFRVEALLEEAGVHVVLTRREDVRAAGMELTGFPRNRADRQGRVDVANEAGAHAFVSIHSNGLANSSVRGLETYYSKERSFAARNYALASAVHEGVLAETAAIGHGLVNRGVRDDSCIYVHRDNCWPMFVLGPARPAAATPSGMMRPPTRATEMPGTLVELLFITNPADARLLQDEDVRQAMARGIARGVLAFLAAEGAWAPGEAD